MTRPRKKYRVGWIDVKHDPIVTIDRSSLSEALADASERLMLLQEELQPNEQIHKPLRRVIYRLDARQHREPDNAHKTAVNE